MLLASCSRQVSKYGSTGRQHQQTGRRAGQSILCSNATNLSSRPHFSWVRLNMFARIAAGPPWFHQVFGYWACKRASNRKEDPIRPKMPPAPHADLGSQYYYPRVPCLGCGVLATTCILTMTSGEVGNRVWILRAQARGCWSPDASQVRCTMPCAWEI